MLTPIIWFLSITGALFWIGLAVLTAHILLREHLIARAARTATTETEGGAR